MLICLLVKLKRKRFNFAYDCYHLSLIYRQIHAGKHYTIKFNRADQIYFGTRTSVKNSLVTVLGSI